MACLFPLLHCQPSRQVSQNEKGMNLQSGGAGCLLGALLSDAQGPTPEGHILEELGLAALSPRETKKGKGPSIKCPL